MSDDRVRAATASELLLLADSGQTEQLKDALSLIHSWGLHDPGYLPVLEKYLSAKDPELLRLTLGILLTFRKGPLEHFSGLNQYLPVLKHLIAANKPEEWAAARFLALELVVELTGPTRELVPYLTEFVHRWPEEASDLVCTFGPLAHDLVPDLIEMLKEDDWDTTWAIVDALGAIGPSAREAVPLLEKLTRHKSGIITGSACVALEHITGKARTSWPRGPMASP